VAAIAGKLAAQAPIDPQLNEASWKGLQVIVRFVEDSEQSVPCGSHTGRLPRGCEPTFKKRAFSAPWGPGGDRTMREPFSGSVLERRSRRATSFILGL